MTFCLISRLSKHFAVHQFSFLCISTNVLLSCAVKTFVIFWLSGKYDDCDQINLEIGLGQGVGSGYDDSVFRVTA